MEAATPPIIEPRLLAGRLEGIDFPDLLWWLCRSRRTGRLRVTRARCTKTLWVEHGHVVFASSEDPDDRLGELLLRQGRVTLDQLETALLRQGQPGQSHKRVGTLLVEAGHLSPEDLVRCVREQVRAIAVDLIRQEEGAYRFEPGPLPGDELIILNTSTPALLLQGVRHVRSVRRLRRSVGGPATVYAAGGAACTALEGLELEDGQRLLLERLRRGPQTIENLCREVILSNFEILQTLWWLRIVGAVERVSSPVVEERTPFHRLLLQLARAGETGVLHASRGRIDRSFHFSRGRCIFATSSDPDDGLLAFLLRRGAISLQDVEASVNRLLSNKRVGAILLELGVIDRNELQRMVCRQLTEIVCDTFRWSDADFRFASDGLPSDEEITLDVSVEGLVAEGLRRTTRWSFVREGCGAMDVPLSLTPDYARVLDAMDADAEEWDVVAALAEPGTANEICRRTRLGDFRVCRILWILRELGAVESCDVERAALDAKVEALDGAATDEAVAHRQVDEPAPVSAGTEPLATAEPSVSSDSRRTPTELALEDEDADHANDEVLEAGALSESLALPLSELHVERSESSSQMHASESAAVGAPERVPGSTEAVPEERDPASSDPAPEAGGESLEASAEAHPVASRPPDASLLMTEPEPERAESSDGPGESPDAEPEVREPCAASEDERETVGSSEPSVDAADPEPESCVACEASEDEGESVGSSEPSVDAADPEPESCVACEASEDEGETVGPSEASADAAESESEACEPPAALEAGSDADAPEPEDAEGSQVTLWDLERSSRTVRLSREEIEQALRQPPDGDEEDQVAHAETPESTDAEIPEDGGSDPLDDWDPPADLEQIIVRFNAMQRAVYRVVRAEVGAGAANVIRSCLGPGRPMPSALASSELLPDGTWDPATLRNAVLEHRIDEPWSQYRDLIDCQLRIVRDHVGDAAVALLEKQLEQIHRD